MTRSKAYIDQHIVPQFLIKRFMDSEGYYEVLRPKDKIDVDKWYTGKDFIIKRDNRTKKFMSANKIYDLSQDFISDEILNAELKRNPEDLEKEFGKLEKKVKEIFDKWFTSSSNVINFKVCDINDVECIKAFILSFLLKNPNLKDSLEQLWKRSIVVKSESMFLPDDYLEKYNLYDIVYLIGLMPTLKLMSAVFPASYLYLFKNESNEPLLLSDTGTTPFNANEDIRVTLAKGTGQFDSFYLPIDAQRAFVLSKRPYNQRVEGTTIYKNSPDQIKRYNHFSFLSSNRAMISVKIGDGMIKMLTTEMEKNVIRL